MSIKIGALRNTVGHHLPIFTVSVYPLIVFNKSHWTKASVCFVNQRTNVVHGPESVRTKCRHISELDSFKYVEYPAQSSA